MSHRLKHGMGGSRCGRGRTDGTETLKAESSKQRRAEDTSEIAEQEAEARSWEAVEQRERALVEQWTPEPSEVVTSDSHTTTVQVTINHMGTLSLDVLRRMIQERFKVTSIHTVDESTRVTKL